MPEFKNGSTLGKTVEGARRELDVFKSPKAHANTTYQSDEVTAICPITSQPDQYTVAIQIQETQWLIESKSLKLYFQSFRNEGIFCEEFASRVCEDVKKATKAGNIIVRVDQKARGGVSIASVSSVQEISMQMDMPPAQLLQAVGKRHGGSRK